MLEAAQRGGGGANAGPHDSAFERRTFSRGIAARAAARPGSPGHIDCSRRSKQYCRLSPTSMNGTRGGSNARTSSPTSSQALPPGPPLPPPVLPPFPSPTDARRRLTPGEASSGSAGVPALPAHPPASWPLPSAADTRDSVCRASAPQLDATARRNGPATAAAAHIRMLPQDGHAHGRDKG